MSTFNTIISAVRKGQVKTYWFELGSVQFPSVQHDSVDGVTCPGSLDGGWEHIQEILEEEKRNEK